MPRDLTGHADRQSLMARVREVFSEMGGGTIRALVDETITRGVFDDEMLDGLMRRGVAEFCRQALKQKTEEDLPFAKPLGGDVWKQLDLFTYEELEALIRREADAWLMDYKELRRLVEMCLLKFGKAPAIPELVEEG